MEFAKYLSVIAASMIKFAGGPLTGLLLELKWYETAICSLIGMMSMVLIIIFLGEFVNKIRSLFFKNVRPKKFTRVNRIAIKIRKKFGLTGIACCSPLIITPAGGTILALAFRYSKPKIILTMLFWGIFWAVVQSLFFYSLKQILW